MRSLEFDIAALEDLAWWIQQDRKKALRIVNLIKEALREPFTGIGKPEPLKHELKGCWSRRIDQEHRLRSDEEHGMIVERKREPRADRPGIKIFPLPQANRLQT